MEGFLSQEWELILAGCGGTSALARGAKPSPRAGSMRPSRSAITQWGWGFHTLRGGIDPGDLRFRPRVVGVVEVRKYSRSGDGNLSSPGAAGPRRWPEGQLSLRAGSMSPSQSAITRWGWDFHTLRGGIDPGDMCFRPRFVEVVKVWKDF